MRKLRLSSIFLLVLALVSVAAAQKSDAAPQMPPNLPMFTPGDLAAKVPAPKPDDVKSLDAIVARLTRPFPGRPGPAIGTAFVRSSCRRRDSRKSVRIPTPRHSSFRGMKKSSFATRA